MSRAKHTVGLCCSRRTAKENNRWLCALKHICVSLDCGSTNYPNPNTCKMADTKADIEEIDDDVDRKVSTTNRLQCIHRQLV